MFKCRVTSLDVANVPAHRPILMGWLAYFYSHCLWMTESMYFSHFSEDNSYYYSIHWHSFIHISIYSIFCFYLKTRAWNTGVHIHHFGHVLGWSGGETPPLRIVWFFSVKQELDVFRKVIIVLVTMTNYKPSMKNVHGFDVIRFLTKINILPRGHLTPPMGQNGCPSVWQSNLL